MPSAILSHLQPYCCEQSSKAQGMSTLGREIFTGKGSSLEGGLGVPFKMWWRNTSFLVPNAALLFSTIVKGKFISTLEGGLPLFQL